MRSTLRLGLLLLSLVLVVPAALPKVAHAAATPATTDIHIPKPLRDWVKKNAMSLYIVFDEIMDDVFGCNCPPPAETPPAPDPPVVP